MDEINMSNYPLDPDFRKLADGMYGDNYRFIRFNGKNSLGDMGLVINGGSPLSPIEPKIVTKEIPFADGAIDISRVDGSLHFNQRTITYDFLFAASKLNHGNSTIEVENYLNMKLNEIYVWLFSKANIDLYDSTYNDYKFTNASCTSIEPSRSIVGDMFVIVASVTFTMDPYLISLDGDRIELAKFVDRAVTRTGRQAVCNFGDNNTKFWLNENETQFTLTRRGPHNFVFGFKPTNYRGLVGIYLPTHYVLTLLDGREIRVSLIPEKTIVTSNCKQEETDKSIFYANLAYGSVIFTVYTTADSFDDFETENYPDPFRRSAQWGMITELDAPDQDHYHLDIYSKHEPYMELNSKKVTPGDLTTFSLIPNQYNRLEIWNDTFDGYYKLYYDSTSGRMM